MRAVIERDEKFMHKALELARKASEENEVPIGALVINPAGEIIGMGYNQVERYQCQRYHAEVQAIEEACKAAGDWRLIGCTLYVTLEPCMMCISLCALSRLERVVYGADSPLFGYRLDTEGVLALYTKQIKNITSSVLADQTAQVLKDFFIEKREGYSEYFIRTN